MYPYGLELSQLFVFKSTSVHSTQIPNTNNVQYKRSCVFFLSIQLVAVLCPETELGKGKLCARSIVEASECPISCIASRSVKTVIKIKLAFRSDRCVEFVLSGGCLTNTRLPLVPKTALCPLDCPLSPRLSPRLPRCPQDCHLSPRLPFVP